MGTQEKLWFLQTFYILLWTVSTKASEKKDVKTLSSDQAHVFIKYNLMDVSLGNAGYHDHHIRLACILQHNANICTSIISLAFLSHTGVQYVTHPNTPT